MYLKWQNMDWGFVAFDLKVFLCNNRHLNELHWALFLFCRDLCISLALEAPGLGAFLFLDIQPHFGCDLPPSSLQLLLMAVSRLRQDGPPDGNSCSPLPEDQLTSISAAKIRREIKYWILIVRFQEVGHRWREKEGYLLSKSQDIKRDSLNADCYICGADTKA